MNVPRTMTLLALCAAISACDAPDTTLLNGNITLNDGVVTLHAKGARDALIDANGTLLVGGNAVSVTPAQHGLLMLYYQSVVDVRRVGEDMGKIGAGVGLKALKNSFDGKSKAQVDQDAHAGTEQLQALAQKICHDEANLKNLQDQLAAQLPAFKPYAGVVSDKDVTDCAKD